MDLRRHRSAWLASATAAALAAGGLGLTLTTTAAHAAPAAAVSPFAVSGGVSVRNENSPDNFVTGSLGPNSVVSGMWVQREKVGLWLTGNNDNLVVQNSRIVGTTADGLNLDGSAHNVTVKNNFLRNNSFTGNTGWPAAQLSEVEAYTS
ncbi:right-handed parallel beta-helix repeat-containing protein [Streptomyces bryophytorum]|uniref:Right handed beta helix domain-containing protein n=1 Tax=Actinacidiphila bryophytorum TaxID=1436133 RepID=A0A9W4GZR3_9ACTN|nr:right-handed parallel beta-helix repeat-containing protein [Actinacidiphila bryophytorum]MBN6545094.1 right-handed parallel beta-helix repeat-containing protein [Actinacidiphila bryophytorum]CAG7630763.1 exported hypothetical protein [Actinacidiphila bryophytorum]